MRTSKLGAVIGLTCLVLLTACGTQKAVSGSDGSLPLLHIGQSNQALGAPAAMDKIATSTWVFNGTEPTTPATGPVLTYDSTAVTETDVTALATSLGLTAQPTKHAHGWDVTDGKATLQVRDSGEWAYSRESGPCQSVYLDLDSADGSGGVACASGTTSTSVASGVSVSASADSSGIVPPAAPVPAPTEQSSCGPAVDCLPVAPVVCPDRTSCPSSIPAPISDAAALAAADPIIKAAHLEGTPYIAPWGGAPATVLLDPTITGLPTSGLQTSIAVDEQGVLNGYGRIGTPAQVGQYPVISSAEALKTLNAMPQPMIDIACPVEKNINPSVSAAPVPLPGCGSPTPMVLTKAIFGLQLQWDSAHPTLVPAWLYTPQGSTDPSGVIAAVAVDPAYIAAPATPTPDTSLLPSAIAVPPAPAGSGSVAGSSGSGEPVPAPTAVASSTISAQSYSITTESVLTLHFEGGSCSTYSGVAKESDKEIVVSVIDTPTNPGLPCAGVGLASDVIVKLSAPIGSRQVIDGVSGTVLGIADAAK